MVKLAMLFVAASHTVDLPPGLQSALCYAESRHKVHAVNHDDGNKAQKASSAVVRSVGPCQMQLATAKLMGFKGTERDLMHPTINVYYSALYLKYQLDRYNGDVVKSVSAYNMGTYKANRRGRPVNQEYVEKVFKFWAQGR